MDQEKAFFAASRDTARSIITPMNFTSGHHGAVYSVVRNPSFPKYLLSIGDWTARIWNEDLKTPIITSKYSRSYLTAAKWSPTRCDIWSLSFALPYKISVISYRRAKT